MPPKKKGAKRAKSQRDAKSRANKKQKPLPCDPFLMIGEDLHRHILGFLLCSRQPDDHDDHYWEYKAPRELPKNCSSCSSVSREWRLVARGLMNLQAPVELGITPRDLAVLKARASRLDLEPICEKFIKDMKDLWGKYRYSGNHDGEIVSDDYGDGLGFPLDTVVQRYSYDGSYNEFAKLVSLEYTKFLVVKCVERIASKKDHSTTVDQEASRVLNMWKEKCMPTKLIDMFWHAHMLSPKKYMEDCQLLIGTKEILDHDAGYVSANRFEGSDYKNKLTTLFQLERGFLKQRMWRNITKMLFYENFDFHQAALEVWEEMMSEESCG